MAKITALLALIGMLAGLALAPDEGRAQVADFPNRPVRIIVPFAPGGSTDTLSRLLSSELSQTWGQPIVIENRGGALGQIAMSAALATPPDGYTLVITTSGTHNMNPWMVKKLQYDPGKTTHIIKLIDAPYALFVSAKTPVNSMQEFIAWAKARAKPPAYGYAGASYEVIIRDLMNTTGIKALGVPYKAQAQAHTDLFGDTLDFLVDATYVVQPFADEGRVKVLMVTSRERSPLLPNTPTMVEAGLPAFKPTVWVGLAGPAGMAPDLVNKIAHDVEKAILSRSVMQRAATLGMEVRVLKGEDFKSFVDTQTGVWGDAIKAANIEPQ
jgi:tripartite-type tricarboxylate transporter receptor subunit TctC